MTGLELMLWRRERKMTQATLASHLGVSRATLNGWEGGKHRLPVDLTARLERIAFTTAPKPIKALPTFINPVDAHKVWPDLALYVRYGVGGRELIVGPEHPRRLLGDRWGSKGVPSSVLGGDEYRTALAAYRATLLPGTSEVDPDASPEEMEAKGEAVRLGRLSPQEREEHAYCKAHGIPWRHWQEKVTSEHKAYLMDYWRRNKTP